MNERTLVDLMKAEVQRLHERIAAEEARIREECVHPLAALEILHDGTTSHFGGRRDEGMRIRCTLCDSKFRRKLEIHDD
jgi:hypothetical protein